MKKLLTAAFFIATFFNTTVAQDLYDSFDDCSPWSAVSVSAVLAAPTWGVPTYFCGSSRITTYYQVYQGSGYDKRWVYRNYSFKAGTKYVVSVVWIGGGTPNGTGLSVMTADGWDSGTHTFINSQVAGDIMKSQSVNRFFFLSSSNRSQLVLLAIGGSVDLDYISIDEAPCETTFNGITGPTAVCDNGTQPITITAPISYGGGAYYWNSNGAGGSPSTNQSLWVNSPGTRTVQTFTAEGCISTASVTITSAATPAAPTISPTPTIVCSGVNTIYSASTNYAYQWGYYGNGFYTALGTSQTQSVPWTPYAISVASLGVYVTGSNGCKSGISWTAPLTVEAPSVTISGQTQICPHATTLLTASSVAGATYLWSNGATTQSITAGVGTYSVTLTTAAGCSATSASVTVSVPTFSATITASNNYLCQGEPVTLTANSGSSYLWSTGATTQSINVSAVGPFTVTVTNNIGCSKTSSPITLTTAPPVQGWITQSGDICSQGYVTLQAGAGYGYSWGESSIYYAFNPGDYSVTYRISPYGCLVSASATVEPCAGCGFCQRVANDDPEDPNVLLNQDLTFGVYPNPVKDKVMVVLSSQAQHDCPVVFHDIMGRLSKSEVVEQGLKAKYIKVSDLEPGMYLVTITDNKRVRQRKLLVQRRD